MTLEDAEDPAPGPGQVLMRVKAAGVNPVDTYVRAGSHGYSPEVPYTPGADAAGIVEAVGPGVTTARAGDRVYGGRSLTGSYAQMALFDESQLFPLPENISFSQGACLAIPYGTAYRALFQKARARAGETVLIHGASGGVGLAAVQLARAAGLTVIGTAGSPAGRKLAQEQGARHALDHGDPAHFEQVRELTGGKGADVIIELLANKNLGCDLKSAARFGRIVVIGSRGAVEVDPRDAMQGDVSVLGMVLKNTPPEEFKERFPGISVPETARKVYLLPALRGTTVSIYAQETLLSTMQEAVSRESAGLPEGIHLEVSLIPVSGAAFRRPCGIVKDWMLELPPVPGDLAVAEIVLGDKPSVQGLVLQVLQGRPGKQKTEEVLGTATARDAAGRSYWIWFV